MKSCERAHYWIAVAFIFLAAAAVMPVYFRKPEDRVRLSPVHDIVMPTIQEKDYASITTDNGLSGKTIFLPGHNLPHETFAPDEAGNKLLKDAMLPVALVGITISGGKKVALVKKVGQSEAIYAQIGQTIEGLIVAEIYGNRIVLTRGSERYVLGMNDDLQK